MRSWWYRLLLGLTGHLWKGGNGVVANSDWSGWRYFSIVVLMVVEKCRSIGGVAGVWGMGLWLM